MANATPTFSKAAGTGAQNAAPVYPVSVFGSWITLHSDLEQAADSSTELLQVYNTNNTGFRYVMVPPICTRVLLRCKYTTAGTSPTNAVVKLYGFDYWADPAAGATTISVDLDGVGIVRLDNASNAAAGVTLTMAASTDVADSTYSYSSLPDLVGYDLLGCKAIGLIVTTAGALTGGTMEAQCRFLN